VITTDLNPQNEAELSTYTLTFLPTNDIGFYQEIIFIFPRSYDKSLGINVACTATSGIVSDISCNQLEDRRLYIDGIESYEVSVERPITIEISGIINPNRGSTDPDEGISIAILRKGETTFIDYIEDAVKITPLKAPGWAFFFSLEETNLHCRYTADYTLNFTATSSIPKLSSSGAIILDLPPQFDIDTKIVSTESYSTEFGTALNSEVRRNRIWIEGNTNDFSGNLKLKVRNIDNPTNKILTDNFVIRTYDGVNKKIIERSFENLDPHYKTYDYPGPLIIINDDKPITVGRGTQSAWIPVTIEGIAALNLTLVPTTPGFEVLPFQVPIQIG
jgi:histone deacetylase 6